jgi:TRAP-type C4-dicarboxylate transport system substrate-binding protein
MRTLAAAVAFALCATAADAEPVLLKFASPVAPTTPITSRGIGGWAKDVNEASEGTLNVQVFAGASIASNANIYDRIMNGVADLGFGLLGGMAAQFPRTSVISLPFEESDSYNISVALWRIYEKGMLADEYKNVRPIALFAFPGGLIHSRKPIRTLEDMKGLKFAVESRTNAEMISMLGAAPITITPPDYYVSLQRGLVDATVIGWAQVTTFKLEEVTSYHLNVALSASPAYFFMNKEAYAKLPDKAKAVVDRHTGEVQVKKLGAITGRVPPPIPGHELVDLPAKDVAEWKSRLAPFTEDWVKKTRDGEKVLAAYRAEVAKVRGEPR